MKKSSQVIRRRQPVRPSTLRPTIRTKVWLERDDTFVIGEGGLDLLHAIDQLGSLTRAADDVGWSYRHAWGYLRNAERHLGAALVRTSPGKGADRGTALTAVGRTVLKHLNSARRAALGAATRRWN